MGSWETENINLTPLLSGCSVHGCSHPNPNAKGSTLLRSQSPSPPQFPTRCKVTIPRRWTLVVDMAVGPCATCLVATYLRYLIQTFHPKPRKDRQLLVNPHEASLCLDGWSLVSMVLGHVKLHMSRHHVVVTPWPLESCQTTKRSLSLVTCSGPQRDSLFDSQISMTFTHICSL